MKNNKTILYLRTDILPEHVIAGGSIAHTLGVLHGFCQLGYTIVCASAILKSHLETLSLEKLCLLSNPKIMRMLSSKINNLVSNIFFTQQVFKLLKDNTVFCIYQRYSLLNVTGVLVKKIKRLPLILEYNGSEVWVDKHWSTKRLLHIRPVIAFFEWLNLKYADYIIVVSRPLYDDLVTRGVESTKILVNPNGVNTDVYNPESLQEIRNEMRSKLHTTDRFVFGFIGTFSPWHGIEMLASIIPCILSKNPNIYFLLIGDGPLKPDLENQLRQYNIDKKHVLFTGLVHHEQARLYLAACDAYVSPTQPNPDGTRFFGSPTKLFEYLSMGKPVIASDLEQIKEIISPSFNISGNMQHVDNHVGVIVPATDMQNWVQAVCNVAALPQTTLDKIGYNARSKAIHYYQWQSHVKKIIDFVV